MATQETAQDRIAFLRGLRAVRNFRADPIPQEVIDAVLDVVRWSGSASNRQPWELIVVRKRDTLVALAKTDNYASHLAGAAVAFILVMAGEPDRTDPETFDAGRLSERIMLAAAAYGAGSCIGSFTGQSSTEVKRILGIPQERTVHIAISVGYTDEEAQSARPKHSQVRKPTDTFVYLEKYS